MLKSMSRHHQDWRVKMGAFRTAQASAAHINMCYMALRLLGNCVCGVPSYSCMVSLALCPVCHVVIIYMLCMNSNAFPDICMQNLHYSWCFVNIVAKELYCQVFGHVREALSAPDWS